MSLTAITSGIKVPKEINVVIEIPMHGAPVKYEANKETGVLFVDRFLTTAMFYPANYGYVPCTLSEDTDPVDVLVVTPMPLQPGTVITCRPVGMLKMADESGVDAKIIAVPINKITKIYQNINTVEDLPDYLLKQIEHFFKHYKDLESDKWVSIEGWLDVAAAEKEINDSVQRFNQTATN